MHTWCIVTYSIRYIGTPAKPTLHTRANKLIKCWMCVYIAKLNCVVKMFSVLAKIVLKSDNFL